MHQRPALRAREERRVDLFLVFLFAEDRAAARAAHRLVGCERNRIRVGDRVGVELRRDEPGGVRHVHEEERPHFLGNLAESLELDRTRIGARPRDDHPRPQLLGFRAHGVVVDPPRLGIHPISGELEEDPREILGMSVGEVAAVVQVHGEDGVARREERLVHRLVRLRPRVGLHVGMLGSEDLLASGPRQLLGLVHHLAAAVVARPGVPLGVFVGEEGRHRLAHRARCVVLGGDELEAVGLALELLDGDAMGGGIGFR